MTRARFRIAIALALVAAVWLVYAPVGGHDFVRYDDEDYLLENPHIAKGLDAGEILWVSTHAYAANYHPLTWISHMLDVQLFGFEPGAHHRGNVLLHALDALLVLLVLEALLGSLAAAGLGAALFALHPLRVESVAWASERKDVLCAFFFLAALLVHLRGRARPSRARTLAVFGLFALAVLAKPMAVTFPLVVCLLDLVPPRGEASEGALRVGTRVWWGTRGPLFLLAALASVITLVAQAAAGSTSSVAGLALDLRVLNAFRSVLVYVGQNLLPRGLSVFYPHAAIVAADPRRALLVPALGGFLLLAALLALAWRVRRSVPAVAQGIGIFLVTLLPVIGLVQVGTQAHADRYTYLPSLGLVLALVGAALATGPRARQVLFAGGLLAAAVLGLQARRQVGVWKNTETLFQHALALDGRNYLAHTMLGERALAEGHEPLARAAFENALAIHPNDPLAWNKLGLCDLARGDTELARRRLQRALALAPGNFDATLNLGVVELESGALATARLRFEECLRRAPERAAVHIDLGLLAQREAHPEEALARFTEAARLEPLLPEAWSHLGQAHLAAGRTAEAVRAFARVVELAPEDAIAHFNLGVARAKDGDPAGARRAYQHALELDPELEFARQALRTLESGE